MSTGYMDKQIALENLLIIRDAFAQRGIPMFLIFGTLLGAMREKGFIGHDDDVDVGVFAQDRSAIRSLMAELEKVGFTMRYSREDRHWKLVRRDTELDFFFAVRKRTLRGLRWDLDGRVSIAARHLDRLDEIEFLGHPVPAPHDPLAVVKSLYGPTWYVPIPGSACRQDWSGRIKKMVKNPQKAAYYVRRFAAGRRRARAARRDFHGGAAQ